MQPLPRVLTRADRLTGLPLAGVLLLTFVMLILLTRLLCVDSSNSTSIWPPDGAVVVGCLLLFGRIRAIFVTLAFMVNVGVSLLLHRPPSVAFMLASFNIGLSILTALGMRRWCGAALDLTRPKRLFTFMAIAAIAASIEATLGIVLTIGATSNALTCWVQWTLCDAMGLILSTPALLILLRLDCYSTPTPAGLIERCALLIAPFGVLLANVMAPHTSVLAALWPLMLVTAARSGPGWLLTSLFGVAMMLNASTLHGLGILASASSNSSLMRQNALQPFLFSLVLCTLVSSSTLREKRRALARSSRLAQAARVATQEAVAANAAKSDFLANMSHEIRTPLNGVVAVADLLARSDLPERERDMAEIIRASGDTLQRLLSDILDMARIESGKVTIEVAPFHAGDMVRAAAGLSKLRCDEKGVALNVEIAPAIDQMVAGDMVRVRQIITNLLSNAVKFTATGEVRLTAERLADGRARFAVRDTGVGFDMADKAKVLGRFQQADTSITRRFGGSGLGLSICANLAELMSGTLDCSSKPGEGALFWLELPLKPALTGIALAPASAQPAPVADSDDPATPQRSEALTRVLVVDDHPTNRQVVRMMLDGLAELTCAEDGRQAVETVQVRSFDVVLMDMQMPILDGLSATRLIRQREQSEGLARTPIIMLTANALPEHMASALAAGADLHLAKPFTPEALFCALDTVLADAQEPSTGESILAA